MQVLPSCTPLLCPDSSSMTQTLFFFFFFPPGPLHAGELQVPPPAGPPQDTTGDQRAEQPDPAEDGRRHAGAADAVHDPQHRHAARGQCWIPSGNNRSDLRGGISC